MALYFVNYDLRKQRDYEILYAELEVFNGKRLLESVWCLKKNGTSVQELLDHFKNFIDANDGLAVSKCEDWSAWNELANPDDL